MRGGHLDPQSFDSFAGDYDRYCDLHDPLGDWLAETLADRYADILAADLSPALVETARLRRPHPGIRYQALDLHHIDDPDGFDLVLSMATLHHVPDLEKALRHLRGLVRPGGTAILVDNVSAAPAPPRSAYLTGAAYEFPRDLVRLGRRDAWWLYRFRTSRPWLAHLLSDRYLTRHQYEERYGAVFPGARFTDLGFAHAMVWHRDG